jgi:hypothetical protein
MREYWPVFAAGILVDVWLVRRIRRSRRFPVRWIAFAALVAAVVSAALWVESFLATQLSYQTLGEGARADVWRELRAHAGRSWPLLAGVAAALLGLVWHPRSEAAITALVVAAGVLLSWMAAMWLYTTNHQPLVFRLLVLPGGLGVVASLVGVSASLALWMAIGRWIWREGRRHRRRQLPPGVDAAV